MRCRWTLLRSVAALSTVAATVGCACGSRLAARPEDLYLGLTRGNVEDRASAAFAVLKNRRHHAGAVVRRAIAMVAARPNCRHLRPLRDTLEDRRLDEVTRASAALALGRIAHDFPCTYPEGSCPPEDRPLPAFAQEALVHCAEQCHADREGECRRAGAADGTPVARRNEDTPLVVARACTEALGYVSTAHVARLTRLRDDTDRDALLRVLAGRAVSRLTGTRAVTAESLERLVLDAHEMAKQ